MEEILFWGAGVCVVFSVVYLLFVGINNRKRKYVHPECDDCISDCTGCSVGKLPDSLGDLDEEPDEDRVYNVNWSSGQDDVPPAPDGLLVFSEGKGGGGKIGQALQKSKGDDVRISYHLATSLNDRLRHLKNMTPAQLEVVKLAVQKIVDHLERAHKL